MERLQHVRLILAAVDRHSCPLPGLIRVAGTCSVLSRLCRCTATRPCSLSTHRANSGVPSAKPRAEQVCCTMAKSCRRASFACSSEAQPQSNAISTRTLNARGPRFAISTAGHISALRAVGDPNPIAAGLLRPMAELVRSPSLYSSEHPAPAIARHLPLSRNCWVKLPHRRAPFALAGGVVSYSALSRKSLSAPDSAPQTSPLRPASSRTLASRSGSG